MTLPLTIENLTAHYGTTQVLEDLSLSVGAGELVSLLGASGCGKTTTLRLVAGFLEPTSGTIRLGGKDLTRLPAYKRDIGLVFQNYALFPHLSVLDNVAFGLKQRGVAPAEREKRARRCWSGSAWRSLPTGCLARCPAARSSAWRWRARW